MVETCSREGQLIPTWLPAMVVLADIPALWFTVVILPRDPDPVADVDWDPVIGGDPVTGCVLCWDELELDFTPEDDDVSADVDTTDDGGIVAVAGLVGVGGIVSVAGVVSVFGVVGAVVSPLRKDVTLGHDVRHTGVARDWLHQTQPWPDDWQAVWFSLN